jgi:hypothetical protein
MGLSEHKQTNFNADVKHIKIEFKHWRIEPNTTPPPVSWPLDIIVRIDSRPTTTMSRRGTSLHKHSKIVLHITKGCIHNL